MRDLGDRLRDIERVAPPDQWGEIVVRPPAGVTLEPHSRRVAVAVAALLIAGAALAPLAWLAFGRAGRPGGGSGTTITVHEPSEVMEPAIHVGQDVVVDTEAYATMLPERGDVVAFRWPGRPDLISMMRVIGLPGESIEQRDGVVFVGGTQLEEPYLSETEDHTTFGPVVVPAGHVFVMGDNRANANDSRFGLGPLPLDRIVGRVLLGVEPTGPAGPPPPAGVAEVPHTPFLPATMAEGSDIVMPVAFPDGSSAEIVYPADMDLATKGVQPDVAILMREDPAPRYGLIFYHGGPDPSLFADEPLDESYLAGEVEVEAWPSHDDPESIFLVYRLPSWSVVVPVPPAVSPDDLVGTLDIREVEGGFPVVRAIGRVALSDEVGEGQGPELTIGDADPRPGSVTTDPAFRLITLWVQPESCEAGGLAPSGESATLCLAGEGGSLFVQVQGDPDFVDAVFRGLRARSVLVAR